MFQGRIFHLSTLWNGTIPVSDYSTKPINYLEIGTNAGSNLLSVAESYGLHIDTKLFCIDPWEDYDEYPEYRGEQSTIYSDFLQNIKNSAYEDKIIVKRGYSNIEVPKFEDDFFDIIYIDGNHEPEFVLEDAVLSFRKLKKGGLLIFDDYGWGGPDMTKRGIDGFMSGYHKKIVFLGLHETQVIIRKL